MDKTTSKEKLIKRISTPIIAAALIVGAGAGIAEVANAQATTSAQIPPMTQNHVDKKDMKFMNGFGIRGSHRGVGVMGTVTSVNGNTVTIKKSDGTIYTVDASSAKISKVVTLSVPDIKVGDTLGVQGSVTGTTVVARHIMDGVPPTPHAPPTVSQ